MDDFKLGDHVRLIISKKKVQSLQRKFNLNEFEYDTYKDLTGYVASIRQEIIKVNYNVNNQKHELIVHRDELYRIPLTKSYNVSVNHSTAIPPARCSASDQITQNMNSSLVHKILGITNRNLQLISETIDNGDAEMLRELCSNNPHIHDRESSTNQSIFHHASTKGNLAILEVVKEAGCYPNAEDKSGNSILHFAVYAKKSQSVDFIISYYRYLTKKKNNSSETPFQAACHGRISNIAIQLLEIDKTVINAVDSGGNAPIHYVASNNSDDPDNMILLKNMLNCENLNLSLIDSIGLTAFHRACRKGIQSIVEAIIDHCQRKQCCQILHELSPNNETGTQITIRKGYISLARIIISKEPTKWSGLLISKQYGTILHTAVKTGSLPLVQLIMLYDLDILNMTNNKGQTPLDIANELCDHISYEKHLDGLNIVKYLTKIGGIRGNHAQQPRDIIKLIKPNTDE